VSAFNEAELAYLTTGEHLARLATVDANGRPHVVPTGFTYNAELDTIDVRGRDLANTKKYRDVRANPAVAIVVDDVLPPWRPRFVEIRGHALSLDDADGPVIRITPETIVSRGLE
jgi:pyridoxamine 5'-phosphate oxidase family protein